MRIRSVAPVLAGLLLISGATAATAFPALEPPPAIQSAVSSQASAPQDDAPISVGFGARAITPVGEPPAEWAPYVHPHPVTGVWGERWVDTADDGCHPQPHRNRPPAVHVDDWWNHAGDNRFAGAVTVRGVTIVGDPQSAGKWDGIWGNAGFGSRCALGANDDIWARAVVIDDGERSVAMVALDVVGLFGIEVERARREVLARYPDMAIDELVVASTHTHQSPDTMGYWGLTLGVDGKYPTYQAFVRSQILDAVRDAWEAREPAELRVARTHFDTGIRDSRPPVVIDPWLHAAQFVRAGDGSTIGTLVRWSNHPEAQGAENPLLSSDFAHSLRERVEDRLGGTAVFFSGSVGGLMTPLGADVPGFGTAISWERTYALGEMVADAAVEALAGAPQHQVSAVEARRRAFFLDVDNNALRALNIAGVFDVPTYAGADSWGHPDSHEHREGVFVGYGGPQMRTEMVLVRIGPMALLTVPGELDPELELGFVGRADCPQAHTGRPPEPVIREQFDDEFLWVIGLGQDELGYIVPGYDFHLQHLPANDERGNGLVPLGGLQATDACGVGHYEETVSASSVLAPWVTCVAAELAGRDPWGTEPACSRENTSTRPYGIGGRP